MSQPLYCQTPPPIVVAIARTPVRVGHTTQVVSSLEFSLSLRGNLRCLAHIERPPRRWGGSTWLSLEASRAPAWLLAAADAAEAVLLADSRLVRKVIGAGR